MPQMEFAQIFITSVLVFNVLALICVIFLMDIDNLMKSQKRNCWPLDSAGLELKQEIFKIARLQEISTLIVILISVFCCIPYIFSSEYIQRADYIFNFLSKHWPKLGIVYTICLIIFTVLIIFPISFSWPLYFMYFSWHVQMQVFILTKFVRDLGENITDDFPLTHCGGIQDEHHQCSIWRNLYFIIQRHTEVLRYSKESMRGLRVSITSLLLGISGSFMGFSALCVTVIEKEIRGGVILLIYLIFLQMLGFSAQAHEDRFGAIYDLALEAPWYQWNVKNRRAYLILIQMSAQVVPYKFFNTRVNRAFQLQLLKTIYSIASIFINI